MPSFNKDAPSVQALVDVELVPMPVAAAVAYVDITGQRKVVGSEAELAEVGRLVAIALSTVAPIYRVAEGPERPSVLDAEEINEALFKTKSPSLEGLAIARADLQRAIVSLKEARASFDNQALLVPRM
jgi:hypothetical protein